MLQFALGDEKMPLINCKQCGNLVLRTKSDYCPECQLERDKCLFKVRNYIKVNPQSTVWEIHEKTGIPLAQILQFNKEEYFIFRK
jgi:uncharacterized OB-fold protein